MNFSLDVAERAAQIALTQPEDIMVASTLLHGVLAPNVDHAPTDYSMGLYAPDGSNRRTLMDPAERLPFYDQAAKLIQELAAHRQGGDDKQFLERAANVLAMTLVLAHPFADGNGRTARTLAHLVREGFDVDPTSHDDLVTLGTNRPSDGGIRSYLPHEEGNTLEPLALLERAAALDIPLSDEAAYTYKRKSAFAIPYS